MIRIALFLSLTSLGVACTADTGDSSLEIVRNLPPGDDCSVIPGGTTFVGTGIIDTGAASGYIFTPEVRSNVRVAATGTDLTITNLVYINGANVELSFLGDVLSEAELAGLEDSNFTKYTQSLSGTIEPGAASGFIFEILPKPVLDQLAGSLGPDERVVVNANVQMFGTLNGGDVDSNEFTYPITVCNGCLKVVFDDCESLPSEFVASDPGTCQLFQDGGTECCMSGNNEICPAVREIDDTVEN